MSRVGATFLRLPHVFSPWSIGRAGASQRRRLITLIAVGWRPPDWPPSGAGLSRGTRIPFGLFTPPRVTPHRGGVSAARGWKPRKLVGQHAAIVRLSVVR